MQQTPDVAPPSPADLAHLNLDLHFFAVADDGEFDLVARARRFDFLDELVQRQRGDFIAVELLDDVAFLDAGLVGWTIAADSGDFDAAVRLLDHDPDIAGVL